MRSDLIFGALTPAKDRYLLCRLAAQETRKLHKPNTRLQDTTNDVLIRFKHEVPFQLCDGGIATLSQSDELLNLGLRGR